VFPADLLCDATRVALLDAGILDRAERGRIIFPFDPVHVDFVRHKAA